MYSGMGEEGERFARTESIQPIDTLRAAGTKKFIFFVPSRAVPARLRTQKIGYLFGFAAWLGLPFVSVRD